MTEYYTATIPLALAEKLKEKGMPMPVNYADLPMFSLPTYGFVFDWLADKGIIIYIIKRKDGTNWHYQIGANIEKYNVPYYDTWHEAAEAAIEKALTLI